MPAAVYPKEVKRFDCCCAHEFQVPYFARMAASVPALCKSVSSTFETPLYLQVTAPSEATNCHPTAVGWRDQALFVGVITVIVSAWVALWTGELESTTFSVKLYVP